MTRPNRLIQVDRYEGDIVYEDDDYLYRVDNFQNLDRIDKLTFVSTQIAASSAFPSGAPVAGAFVRLSTGTVISQGVDASNTVVRSTDGGFTWNTVTTMDAEVLHQRGIALITLSDGSEAVALGGYEVFTPGENIQIKLLTDDGATVTTLNSWSVDDAFIKHIHAIRQDPFTGKMWVCIGDSNSQTGMLVVDQDKINDTAAWANIGNVALSSVNEPGFTALRDGTQKFRATDVAFTERYAYIFADASNTGIYLGVVRITKSDYRAVYIDKDLQGFSDHHQGFWSLPVTSDQIVHVPLIAVGPTDNWNMPFYSHKDDSLVYKIGNGQIASSATKFVPRVFWKGSGDKIYFSGSNMAGSNDQKYTVVFKVADDVFKGPEPDNFWPVYFVSPTGSSSAGTTVGIDPRNPAGITAVLNRGSGCGQYQHGSCFLFQEGNYETTTNLSMGDYNNGTFTYETTGTPRIQLRGTGDNNILGKGASYLFTIGGAIDFDLLISNFAKISMDGTQERIFLGNSSRNTDIVLQDVAQWGDPEFDTRIGMEVRNEDIRSYRTLFNHQNDGSNNQVIRLAESSPANRCRFRAYDSIIKGGNVGIHQQNDGEFESYNSVTKDYGSSGHFLEAGATNVPIYENSVIHSSEASATPFDDNAGADYTGNIKHIIVDKESSFNSVEDSEYDTETVVDPLVAEAGHIFNDPANNDYLPVVGSTAHQRGIAVKDVKLPSRNNRARLSPPSIGPDEQIAEAESSVVAPTTTTTVAWEVKTNDNSTWTVE